MLEADLYQQINMMEVLLINYKKTPELEPNDPTIHLLRGNVIL